jgi:hypothetical protein
VGIERVMLCASSVPSEALLPTAATHRPLATAADVADELTRYVVDAVVVTLRVVAPVPPNPWVFTTIVDPEMLVTVPVAPVPTPPNPPARPARPGAPVGRVVGRGVGTPDGRPPRDPRPANPDRVVHAVVPVTVTVVARTVVVADGDGAVDPVDERRPELAVTQSPTATDERDPLESRVNRVDVAHATTVVPEPVATLTPEPDTAVALPEAAVKEKPPTAPREVVAGAVDPALAVPLADPQPATTRAASASPAAGSARERVAAVRVISISRVR